MGVGYLFVCWGRRGDGGREARILGEVEREGWGLEHFMVECGSGGARGREMYLLALGLLRLGLYARKMHVFIVAG